MADSDSYFPPDVLLEILQRLPVKALIRFTVVSKSCNSLITSPAFISKHLTQASRNHTHTLLIKGSDSLFRKSYFALFQDCKDQPFCLNFLLELNFPFPNQLEDFEILGSCNGILCLYDMYDDFPSMVLWNPSIQKYITLPSPSIIPQSNGMRALGFGATNNNDDYKVVRVVYHSAESVLPSYNVPPPEVEIYSFSTGVWRRVVGVEIKHCIVKFMWSQTFLNGAVHWIAYNVGDDGVNRSLIMSFSIADEVFGEITLPGALASASASCLSITVLEGFLAVVKYEWEIDFVSYEVWVMKHFGVLESWTRLHCINLVADMEKLVGFRSNGEVLFSTSSCDLVSYDPSTGDNTTLGIHGIPHTFYVQNYMESLALLQRDDIVTDEFLDEMGSLCI